jgi:hypothetical protein
MADEKSMALADTLVDVQGKNGVNCRRQSRGLGSITSADPLSGKEVAKSSWPWHKDYVVVGIKARPGSAGACRYWPGRRGQTLRRLARWRSMIP